MQKDGQFHEKNTKIYPACGKPEKKYKDWTEARGN